MLNLVSNVFGPAPAAKPGSTYALTSAGKRRCYWAVRAAIDFSLALVLLVLASPVLIVAMALVKLTSRGPVLYSQTRVGRGGRPFTIYKLRTMFQDSESLTGPCWCKPGDSRITPVGRWLRRTHIDELAQLFNVLKGDMSLIGPRPERPEFVPQLEKAIALYRRRLAIRPGLTGLAQIQLPADTDLESVRKKLAYDLYYLDAAGWWLDLRIHLATIFHVAGASFSLIRRLFAFADQETIETAYLTWTSVEKSGPLPAQPRELARA